MSTLRVLHMIGSLEMGGAQNMVMSLYRAVDRNKIQFDFIIDCDTASVFTQEIHRLGGRIFRLPKINEASLSEVRSSWNKFFTDHPEYKILHSHVRSYASVYLPIAKAHGVKTIIHSHNTSNGTGLASLIKKALQYPLRYQADYFFGCSEIAGQWLFGDKVVKSDRYFMLKNAVDMGRFAYRPAVRAQIREELGVDENTLLIGHVGRMNPQKNHKFLIECFRKVVDKRADAKLILLGDGDLRDEVSHQITQLGLDDHVLMLGVRSNVEDYFSAMDCMVLPSLHEGLPVVVVEAQANGLRCLVSDTVTREVRLSQLVEYLPISQGAEPWVNAILAGDQCHVDVSEQIRSGGFCVKESAQWLSEFYSSIGK